MLEYITYLLYKIYIYIYVVDDGDNDDDYDDGIIIIDTRIFFHLLLR